MSMFRLHFGGFVKKLTSRQAGNETVIELQLCRKNRGGKPGEPDTFTWVRVSVWKPAEFLVQRLAQDVYVCGSGDVTLRSYTDAQGAKKSALECRCSSYDLDIGDRPPGQEAAPPAAATAPARPAIARAAAPADDDEPPF